jgi:23S rRNA (adenine2503-C2)-methyltransferase
MSDIHLLRERLYTLGANPAHAAHVLRAWLQARPSMDTQRRKAEHHLPQALRTALPALMNELNALARIHTEHPAGDGSAKLLIALADGQTVEAVRLPRSEGLCVSSQVGCAVGCTFCMTGTMGLVRQLSSLEIAAQVALARQQRPVHKVVFMGMGEPAHNLDNVMDAIELLGKEGGIGHKQLVFSTVGDARVFERFMALPEGAVKPALALSLHTTNAERRRQLLPRAPRIEIEDLVARGEAYARASGYPIQYQWALLESVNDGDDEIDGIVALLKGRYAVLNMIPYNAVDGLPYQRPSIERCAHIARTLHQRGVLTKLRQSAGQEVDAGCGQLRARALSEQPVRWV